jgi:NitT/TauT family transport system substrate-binding protein
MTNPSGRVGLTGLGVFVTFLMVVGLIGLGVYVLVRPAPAAAPPVAATAPVAGTPPNAVTPSVAGTPPAAGTPVAGAPPAAGAPAGGPGIDKLIEPLTTVPHLDAAAAYVPKNGVIEVDLSEYAGYAGLIVANGGLDPNPDSIFTKQFGIAVKLSMSEDENWSPVNNGRLAATATTVDALPVMGRQFQVIVPAQIGFSRGADGVVVASSITSVNQLAGKVVVASQFNEADFFIRYLAQEAGLDVVVLPDLSVAPPANRVGLVFCEDSFIAGDVFLKELAQPKPRLAGCVTWAPKTFEVIDKSQGKARMLVSNKNLLVIADILVVNKGFADANPKAVQGLVGGLLTGNHLLNQDPTPYLATIAKAFSTKDDSWTPAKARDELSRVHLSNLPENQAFFAGTIDAAGSYGSIYQSSLLAYGSLIQNPVDGGRFLDGSALKAADASGQFAQEVVAIAPIKSGAASAIEGSPLLSKDIRFLFQPNSSELAADSPENRKYLETIRDYLQVSPGSMVLLRGHVDNARVSEFRDQGGEALVHTMALKAVELSKARADAVRKALLDFTKVDPARVETVGRGWEEPAGTVPELNRRVEAQWFTLE